MKVKTIVGVLMVVLLFSAACEKDDICVDGDTPLLRIDFFDDNDASAVKNVSALQIEGLLNGNEPQGVIPNISLSAVGLPLRLGTTSTTFILSQNLTPNDSTTVNIDTLTFTYSAKEVFVSRACGFIANFDDLGTELTTDPDNWIKRIEIVDTLVANSESAHVKIFH
ncbi:DUF6452 family protein [Arenibacter sp. GZD96]|uniref:DUF6452 family protein n=1 Tax=Aurantibrevibacter litoralis TaxID=3106030 RepID=UPI002AFE8390|nr:DUF6452 family protein [Arenibacter sp. GZD-96]MEA1785975.1 DUF6452 family protein [Arenibacter sp. GZD-96]